MPSTVEVTVTSSFDKYNKGISQGAPVSLALGSNLSLDASGIDTENIFAFWVINGVVRNDLSELDSIRVKSSMHIQAVFHKAGEHAVLFVDSNGKLISTEYVLNGDDVTAPSYSGYTKLGMSVDTTTPWKTLNGVTSLTAINSSRVYVLQYTTDVAEVKITLSGATVSSVVANKNDVVTLVASNVSTFKYWKNASDEVLSFESTYVFTATKNMTITAEYADETQTPANLVTISEDLGIREGYDTYVGRFELQSGSAFEYGFLVSKTSSDVTLETSDVEIVKSNAYNAETNEFIMSFTTGSYMSVKAYLIADEGTLVNYVSGSNRTTELSGFASDLLISEYIESSADKAIEIYNGTSSSITLDGVYSLRLYANGNTTYSTILLTGTILANDTYIVANSTSNPTITSIADLITGSMSHNGNDVYELVKNGITIDSIGQKGSSSAFGEDMTAVRKSSVSEGRVNSSNMFELTTEWIVYGLSEYSYLGNHSLNVGATLSNSEKSLADLVSLSVVSTKKDTNQLTLPVIGPNQSTITWTSDSPHLITNAGLVTLPSGQPETVILTARVVNGSSVRNREFQIIVGLTDAEKVALDAEALSQPTSLTEPTTLTLPATGTNNSSIVWTSESSLVNTTSGLVSMPESGQVTVTLTATLTLNAATEVVAFDIVLGIADSSNILIETINFGTTDTGASNATSATNFATLWNDRASSNLDITVSEITSITKIYTYANLGDNNNKNIKLGNSTAGGVNLVINFSNITIQEIVINGKAYGTDTGVKFILNGVQSSTLTSTLTDYTFQINSNSITLSLSGKRAYINSITFSYTLNP